MSEPQDIVKGIDHLIVMVRDLDRSQSLWRSLGFATTDRGFHQTGGTANHLLMLDRTYIELLGVVEPSAASPYLALIEESPGLWGVALRGSADDTYRLWHSRGLPATLPTSLARGVEIGGRDEMARFRLTLLERSPALPFLLFCCQHLTPQFVWHPHAAPHPNGARSLRELVMVVEDDDRQTPIELERVTAQPLARSADGSGILSFEDTRISLLTPAALLRRYGAAAALRKGRRPMLAGFVLGSSDLDQAQRFAQGSGYPIHATPAGGFATSVPDEGVIIEWAP